MLFLLLAGCVLMGAENPSSTRPAPPKTATITISTNTLAQDPVELELRRIMIEDDKAQDDVDRMIKENEEFKRQGAGLTSTTLNARIQERFSVVKKEYENFIEKHPKHARVRLAYGSFLNDIGEDFEAMAQWEKSRELDPTNPAAWNNLANYYGHRGPIEKAFQYYEKAIELNPNEPVYLHNYGTTVFLFRKDAQERFKINEQQVFDKALELYTKAIKLDPKNFPLASDVAQTYYGIKPLRYKEAMAAWEYAMQLASDSFEREGVQIHFARLKIQTGDYAGASNHLAAVTNEHYNVLKARLERNILERQAKAAGLPLPAAPAPAETSPQNRPPAKPSK